MLRAVFVTLLLGACGGGAAVPAASLAAPSRSPSSAADAAFAKLADDYFDAGDHYSPTGAVNNGFHAYDAQIEDRSRARIEQRIGELHGFLGRVTKLDRAALSFDNAIDAQAIKGEIRSELLTLDTLKLWAKNPMTYAGLPGGAIDAVMKRDFAPKKDRLRSLIARLRGVPAIFAAGRANVVDPPKEFTDVALGRAKGTAGFLEGSVTTWARDAAEG